MAEIYKPTSLNAIWASAGDKIKPSDQKIQEGWAVEIPPRQYFNWLENRRDSAIGHINQRGIVQWDALTDYLGNRSYVQAADGRVYKCVIANRGKDPMVDNVHWIIAFASNDDPFSRKAFIGYVASSGDLMAVLNSRYYFSNTATITLPKTAQRGDAVVVSKAPDSTVYANIDTGLLIRTHLGEFAEVEFDVYDEIQFIYNGTMWEVV